MISPWNALLWEVGNAPKPDVIRSRLDIFQEGCVSDKRSNWAQLVLICTSKAGMVVQEPEKVMKMWSGKFEGFPASSLSAAEWCWAQKRIECCLKGG